MIFLAAPWRGTLTGVKWVVRGGIFYSHAFYFGSADRPTAPSSNEVSSKSALVVPYVFTSRAKRL